MTTQRARTRNLSVLLLSGILLTAFASVSLAQTPPLRYLEGHTRSPFAVAWMPDGKTLLSGGFDETIRAWDRETGKPLTVWTGVGRVLTLAVSKDGLTFASGGTDRTLRLFDAPLRDPLPTFANAGVNHEPVGLSVSPDGTLVLVADKSGLVRLWNAQTAQHLRDFGGSTGEVSGAALTADGKHVLASCIDGSLRIWNAANAQLVATLWTPHNQSLAVSPDGQKIATADKDGVLRTFQWPAAPPKRIAAHNDVVNGLAVSSKGEFAVSGGNDQLVQIVNVKTGQPIRNLANQPGPVTGLALSPDDATVVTGSATGMLKLWNVANGAEQPSLLGHDPAAPAIHGLAFTPKGDQFISVGQDMTVRIWDRPTPPVKLTGHGKPVQAAVFSADAKTYVTASGDNTLRLWTADGKPGPVLQGHKQPVTSVALSADGQWLASGDATGLLRLWKRADNSLLAEFVAHTGPVTGLAFHPNNKSVLSSGTDGLARAWTVSPAPSATLAGHTEAVTSVAATSDGKFLVSGGNDQTLRLFDAAGKPVKTLGEKLGPVTGVAVNSKNTLIAAASNAGVVHVVTPDGKPVGTLEGHVGAISAVVFQKDTDKLATAGQDATIRIWSPPVAPRQMPEVAKTVTAVRISPNGQSVAIAADNATRLFAVANAQPQPVLNGHTGVVHSVAWRADGSQLVTCSADKSVRIWTAANGMLVKAFENLPAEPKAVAITPDGNTILWGGTDNLVHQVNVADGTEVRTVPGAGQPITALVLSADGQTFAAASADGGLRIHKVADGGAVASAIHGAAVHGLALSADGMKLASCGADNLVKVWNAANGAAIVTGTGHTAAPTGVAFSANNELLASCGHDATVRVWDATGRCVQQFTQPKTQFTSVAFGADNRTLVAGAVDGHTHVFTVSFERVITGHEGPVTTLAFAPNGQWIVSGGQDKTVRSWTLADGKQVFAMGGATDIVTRVAVNPDSTLAVATSQDKILRSWNLTNGQPVGTPVTLPAALRGVALNADGKLAAVGGDDNLVRVIDLASGKELQQFPGHAGGVTAVTFLGSTLVSSSADKSLRTWTLSAERVYAGDPTKLHDVAFTKDGAQFLTSGEDRLVKLWDTATGQLVRQYGGAEAPQRHLQLRGDGLQIAGGGTEAATDRNVYLWDFASGGLTLKITTPAAVTSVGYSADGTMVVAGGADHHLRVYRTADGKLLEDVTGTSPVTAVALGTDNRTVLTGWADNSASLQRIALRQVLTGHEGPVTCVAVSPKGDLLLTGSHDRTVRAWSLPEGKPLAKLMGAADILTSVAISADGQRAVAGSQDKHVRSWNLAGVQQAAALDPEFAIPQAVPIRSVALDGKTRRLAFGGDDNLVHVWDLASVQELERFPHQGAVTRLAFLNDGTQLVSGSADRTVQWWPLFGQRAVGGHQGPVVRLAYSADNAALWSAATDKLLVRWKPDTLAADWQQDVQSPLRAFAQQGPLVATVSDDQQLRLWKAGQAQPLAAVTLPAVATGVALSPTGDRVVAGCADKLLRSFSVVTKDNATQLVPVQECTGHAEHVTWLAFDAAGQTVYSAGNDRRVFRWQIASASPRVVTTLPAPIDSLAFAPDGKALVAAAGKDVILINTADGKPTATFSGHTARVMSVAWHPNNQFLLSGGTDATLRVWNLKGEPVRAYEGLEFPLFTFALSPDGGWLLAGGRGRELHGWSFGTEKPTRTLLGHNAPVYRVSINPAGSRTATLDHAGELCIWDNGTNLLHHQALPVLAAHSLAYSPDGKDLAVATQDNRVLIVPVPPNVQ